MCVEKYDVYGPTPHTAETSLSGLGTHGHISTSLWGEIDPPSLMAAHHQLVDPMLDCESFPPTFKGICTIPLTMVNLAHRTLLAMCQPNHLCCHMSIVVCVSSPDLGDW